MQQFTFMIFNARRFRILVFMLLCLMLLKLFSCSGQKPEKPNIVLIFIDDWAWNGSPVQMHDEMINSAMPVLQMPNLQTLRSHGMKFTNAYASAPQCSPSRVSLQTGQSSARSGFTVYMNDGGSDYYDMNPEYSRFPVVPCVSDMTIDEDAVTIPKALNSLGYVCAHFGKWHMRGNPEKEGYAAHDGATTNTEGNQNIDGDPKLMYSLTERSVKFMKEQVESGQPFFLQISHWAMHEGRECLSETREKYARMPEIQEYYQKVGRTAESINWRQDPASWLAMGENLDECIGKVMQAIKELGIEDNTYLIVTSDNGYREAYYPLHQPLHGAKWWVWDGGLRVPKIVAGPGIEAGSSSDTYVVNYDLFPTFLEWAGGKLGEFKDIDGKSLVGIFRGEKPAPDLLNRNLFFHYPHYRTSMPHSAMISAGRWKVMHFYEAPDIPMLFDLNEDIAEVKNIASLRKADHERLFSEMMSYFNKVGARLPKDNPDFDTEIYKQSKEYEKRVLWGPFSGERPLEDDEK
jgi:arylsulfatase A